MNKMIFTIDQKCERFCMAEQRRNEAETPKSAKSV